MSREQKHPGYSVPDKGLVARVLRLDLCARRPHQRADGEDIAAGARTGQIITLDVAAKGGDPIGILTQFREALRRFAGIEPCLGEQILVIEQRRHIGVKRNAIESLVEGGDHHVTGGLPSSTPGGHRSVR
jgi:hypothetical protein